MKTSSRSIALACLPVLVPFGCALAAAALVTAVVPPRWNAPGLPFFLGHPKNVESAATAAAFLTAVAAAAAGTHRRSLQLMAAAGLAVLLARGHLRVLAAAWLPLAGAFVGPTVLGATPRDRRAEDATTPDVARPLGALAAGVLAVAGFVVGTEPLSIDVFHHGEVLGSALDVLHGGIPFKSYVWPHGVHDTGLAALWIAASGKIGTSPVALARATCRAFGVLAAYAFAARLLGRRSAALGVAAVLALMPLHGTLPGPAECPDMLYQLGILAFVIAALLALVAERRGASVAAGALLACGHLFRIETALYGAVAAVALLASRVIAPADSGCPLAVRVRRCGLALGGLALGAAAVLGASRLALGWPDGAWFAYTFGELPRYHRDAVGIPFPWPLRGELADSTLPHRGAALAWLCFVLALGVATARAVALRAPAREILVFVTTFAFLATRSSLDRSDTGHFLQWATFPLVAVVLLLVVRARDARWPRAARAVLLVAALLWIDGPVVRAAPLLAAPSALVATARERWRATIEHLAPNPPIGPCADTTMTALEAARPKNAHFLAAVCDLETLLRRHDARGLVIAHSAPWYYVRLGLRPPTRHFAFSRAYTPRVQRELVEDLRAAHPMALLRVHGFEALEIFDVPDAVRVPVVDAYLRARTGGVRPYATPLGEVYFWNEPGSDDPPTLRMPSEETVDYPDAGRRLVFGWTTDHGASFPLVSTGDRSYATIDGRSIRTSVTSARSRTLPRLDGDVWRDLAADVDRASALGASDRAEALRSNANARPTPASDGR